MAVAPATAAAVPRRIAVLNAASDGAAGARAAATLRRALLVEQPELSPLAAGDLSRALEDPLPAEAEGEVALRQARIELDAARTAIAHFEQALARRALARAEHLLLSVEPDERVTRLLADVCFQTGLVNLREQNRGLAVDAFRQVVRLTPEREALDPARYPPEVIHAFEAARKSSGESGVLEVSTTFDGVPVYIDGVRIGLTPLRTDIAPGPHYLLLAAPEFLPQGQKLDAVPRERLELVIELDRLPVARRASDMRRRLAAADGERRDSLRRAGRDVALLAGVDAVLVVGDGGRAPSVAVYERNADRLSLFRPVDPEVHRLFGLLLPAPPPAPFDLLPEEEREQPIPWYLRPWAVATMSGGLVLGAVGVFLITSGTPPPFGRDADSAGF
ncbi:MAG TPA: PEGA domain-containing protein [Kofleriaceae bacterium]|nr:PEGA domain-containing protein [Kofleriaceae bacterium]